MVAYVAPNEDYRFIFRHVLRLDRHADLPSLAELGLDDIDGILAGAAAVCESALAPVNAAGDIEGSRLTPDGAVTATGFPAAYAALRDGGWIGLQVAAAHGGPGLPNVVGKAVHEMRAAASMAVAGFAELTEAVFMAIERYGTGEQKAVYLPPLANGRWAGAMHLTEPQAGSDIGLIRTRARAQPGGHYLLSGSKIFISDAEQDLTDNVVNLVLARVEGAPSGTRGLSLFLVPRILPTDGRRNTLGYVSLEHKMGLHGSVTGTIVYDDAVGYLVGSENEGLAPLFTMVNETRLGVGLQGLAVAATTYQAALAYARERRQGKAPGAPSGPGPDALIAHADVRRMLLQMASFVEGARALSAWVALQIDIADCHPDAGRRATAGAWANMMTPLVKAFFTDEGFACADLALQVHGGHGYIRDTGIEQLLRDVRVTRIYEGANGIIAYDLARRKVCADGGAAMAGFIAALRRDAAAVAHAEARALVPALLAALQDLEIATQGLIVQPAEQVGAVACDYLRLAGLCALGWSWVLIADAVPAAVAGGDISMATARRKLLTAQFFLQWRLGETALLSSRVRSAGALSPCLAAFEPD